jgi:hypothetical protein
MSEVFVDWKATAQDLVAYLRLASGQRPATRS